MAGSGSKDNDVFNLDRIKSLVELMQEYGLSEVDLRHEKQVIKLRRGISQATVAPALPVAQMPAAPVPAAPDPAPLVAQGQRDEDGDHIVLIKSPMVGTFYSRANPEAAPFVQVGDRVGAEKTVCIIEAMKVFNEIPAEVSGTIVSVLVDDEEAVDYGKPLFKVDTSK